MSIFSTLISKLSPTGIMATVYKWLAIVGIALGLSVAGFFYGKHYGDEQSKVVVASYEAKVTNIENELNKALEPQEIQVVTKYQTQILHDQQVGINNGKTAITQVQEVKPVPNLADDVDKYLSVGWVLLHDASAADRTVDSSSAANGSPSTFTAIDALSTVVNNYATCNQYRATIIGLQTTINNYNNTVAQINSATKKKK